ncbi:MAG: TrkH family potassium uptake protein [Clostridia bacterium]|nr:TrkH family potassium uptake protein [Clostridia bacterium]
MNKRSVINLLGKIVLILAAALLLPALVSLIYGEGRVALVFLLTAVGSAVLGLASVLPTGGIKMGEKHIFAREGFMIVGLAWVVLTLIGALPFVITGELPSYIDAIFETASGFSTTGATAIADVEILSHGIQFWRSLTHWMGGMGVLTLLMALAPTDSDSGRAMHILRAEMPGPVVGKLVPRIRTTAIVLYAMYIFLTLLETILLCFGGMTFYEAIIHAMSTAGTGGFGIYNPSIGGFNPFIQWVIIVFMLLFSLNFTLYYLIAIGKLKEALSSRELWLFFGIYLIGTGIITFNIRGMYGSFGEAVRTAAFESAAFASTTGFGIANPNLWPTLSKVILIIFMLIGGCAGSTAGGLKLSRVMLMCKYAKKNLKETFRPRSVNVVRQEGRRVDNETVHGAVAYLVIYVLILSGTVFLISIFESFDFERLFTSAISCLNNIGPVFSSAVAEPGFVDFSPYSKIVLAIAMLLGRLELYPVLFIFTPSAWTDKNRVRARR